ncbi:MAG: HNH endonuclease [Tannerellaceae bacterium]|jgi:5-methylcytosine-specific restriction protein A|nr:HNH endonuclease [Tannerellaceae bacterium]
MPTIYKPKKPQRKDDTLRRKERREIYSSTRWQKLREWKMINNPLCEKCLEKDRVSPTEDIHHIISFMSTEDPLQRKQLAYDYDNLMSLCKECHQKIHNGK